MDDAVARAQFEEWFADEPTNPDRLLPDLRPYYRPKGGDGLKHWAMLKHPLVFQVPFVSWKMANDQYLAKRARNSPREALMKMKWLGMYLALALALPALFVPQAAAQTAGVKGKSSFEVVVPFVSGGGEVDFTLKYRATESWAVGVGLSAFSGGGITGQGFGVGAAYYPAVSNPAVEPYLFGEFVSLSARSVSRSTRRTPSARSFCDRSLYGSLTRMRHPKGFSSLTTRVPILP